MTLKNNNPNRNSLKIDQEEFNRKAQHILDTVVKPQVEKYEQAKAKETFDANSEEFELILQATMVPEKHLG